MAVEYPGGVGHGVDECLAGDGLIQVRARAALPQSSCLRTRWLAQQRVAKYTRERQNTRCPAQRHADHHGRNQTGGNHNKFDAVANAFGNYGRNAG